MDLVAQQYGEATGPLSARLKRALDPSIIAPAKSGIA